MFHNRRQLISAARRPFVAAAGGPYAGPGDIQAFLAWWGLRGYNAAYSGPAIDIFDANSLNPATISIVGGSLDMVTLNAWIGAPGNHGTAYVKKIYDQVGTNHLSATNVGQAPPIQVGATGLKSGYPTMLFSPAGAGTTLFKGSGLSGSTVNQPWSMSCFALSNPGSTTNGLLADTANFTGLFMGNGTLGVYANVVLQTTLVADTWISIHTLVAPSNGSYVYVDGTIGAGPADAGPFVLAAADDFAYGRAFNNFDGKSMEAGVINGDGRSNFIAIAAQQRAYWLP